MKNIFKNIVAKFKSDIPEVPWVDLEKGQMNFARPPIRFPSALVKIDLPQCENLNSKKQRVNAKITIKLCYDFTGETSNITPDAEVDKSLKYLDTYEKVYTTFQGWGTADMNPLSRITVFDEPRPDNYKTVYLIFSTDYHDHTAAP